MNITKTPYKLLLRLCDGEFHSGQALGLDLGITRSAVWKGIKHLVDAGIDVQCVTGRGYRIQGGVDLLHEASILQHVDTRNQQKLHQLELLQQVHSTNDYLLAKANANTSNQVIACFSESQTSGKGRRGRIWSSPYGANIYHSLLWPFQKDPSEIVGLSLVAAIATMKAFQAYGIAEQAIGIKWPNDFLYKQAKVGGVLVEMVAQPHGPCQVVIGVGINTRLNAQQPKHISQPCTSLEAILNRPIQRNQLAGLLLNSLMQCMQIFAQDGLAPFIKQWPQYDLLYQQPITLHTANAEIHGIMQGVSERGELLVLHNQEQKAYLSGEVSVRF